MRTFSIRIRIPSVSVRMRMEYGRHTDTWKLPFCCIIKTINIRMEYRQNTNTDGIRTHGNVALMVKTVLW